MRLPDLARRLDLSPPHAGREVKRLFGKSFPRLCHETKMREAARLLAATDAPIREIAVRVGYADANHLSRLFRQEFKMPPRAYRRAHRADA